MFNDEDDLDGVMGHFPGFFHLVLGCKNWLPSTNKPMKNVAIIQARMGSSRLPGKVLMPLAGRPVILWVCQRARMIQGVDEVVVATTISPKDDELAEYCRAQGIPVFRGSEHDVLDRYIQAGRKAGADAVMRITADCPFLDPVVSATVLDRFLETSDCDYATNTRPPTFPDGLDTSITRFSVLERIWREAPNGPDREHVTLFIVKHPEQFHIESVTNKIDLSACRWTLDESRDYEMLSRVAEELVRRGQFGYMEEILAILEDYPGIAAMNKHIQRNEGLRRSWDRWRADQTELRP